MTDHVWKFKDRKTQREAFYGNLRELYKNETIIIGGRIKKEMGLRYLLRYTNTYSDENYIIQKVKVKRSKIK
tara:strand:- start:9941 stop:10156 length:216 start_codon:yes stop_codon:yes gene_type:complete